MDSSAQCRNCIDVKHAGVSFGSVIVHRDVTFHVESGEVVTILGPSGTGKTIILKIIIGLMQPSHGEVWVMGRKVSHLPERKLRSIRRNIGMLFQGAALFDSLSVFENVAYSLREFHESSEQEIARIVNEKLEIVGLPGIGHKYPPQLSGGQKKRVGLARALASSPKIMLFDEPTTGLDPTAVRMIDSLILKLKNEYGITSIVVTHDIASARRVSDRWILVNQGRVLAEGGVEDLSRNNQDVINFISGAWSES